MFKRSAAFCLLCMVMFTGTVLADSKTSLNEHPPLKVGIFASVYLDSAFNGTEYKYEKNFPRFTFAGLDFLQGAQIALDSLYFGEQKIIAGFYDVQSSTFNQQLESGAFNDLDLIIGAVRDPEFNALAQFAYKQNIPFVSVTYPNDGGITQNPFLIILNSTLKAHCEYIYGYALQQFGNANIVFASKTGTQEERVKSYFTEMNEPDGSPLMKLKYVLLDNGVDKLTTQLDTSKLNIIIGASLDESFAKQLAKQSIQWKKKYDIQLIGMPNWDNIFNFKNAKNFTDLPIHFTRAFYNEKDEEQYALLENTYQQKFLVLPSEYAQKGFESIAMFVKLLTEHPDDFMSFINNSEYKTFSAYRFRPVKLNDASAVPDYFENKQLYFMKSVNGKITKAW